MPTTTRSLALTASLLLILTLLAYAINAGFYHYQGNNFFPEEYPLILLLVLVFNSGLKLYYPFNAKPRLRAQELLYFVAVLSLIAFASNAVQLTPFPPIDKHIIALESQLGIHLPSWVAQLNAFPSLKNILILIYDSLPYQMSLIPLVAIAFGCHERLRAYYFLMLFTALLGFSLYYFFPTIAPASMFRGSEFLPDQFATGLKFYQIHHHLVPTTNAGGLIAFPSFHVVWAVLCVYLTKDLPFACFALGLLNFLLVLSCVFLGWHYPLDVLGALLILAVGFLLLTAASSPRSTSIAPS